MTVQLDIFGEPMALPQAKAKRVSYAWSFSKMQAFHDCPRRYYFNYYGSKKKTAKDEPLKEKLIELSKLSNKYMMGGGLIHSLISLYFKKARANDAWDYQRMASFAAMIFGETIRFNTATVQGRKTEQTERPKQLLKELLTERVSPEVLTKEVLATINQCLKNFYTSDAYEFLRKGGIGEFAKIEGDTSFELSNDLDVDGKVDIAFVENGVLHIADWKTGKKSMEDTSLQLLVYALWARQVKEWEFNEVVIYKAYLMDGSLEKLEFSEVHIERARARILQDAEMIREMDEYGRGAVSDAFAKHEGKNCLSCPYEEICKIG